MKQKLIDFYLDYVNNFLTMAGLAEYYSINEDDALVLIDMGKKYHEEHVAQLKATV